MPVNSPENTQLIFPTMPVNSTENTQLIFPTMPVKSQPKKIGGNLQKHENCLRATWWRLCVVAASTELAAGQ
jgi:hypothetical protein